MIEKLLFATRFEELQFDALQSLLSLRQAGLNHVVFLSVIERDKVAMRRGSGYHKRTEVRLREKINIRFIDWAETLFEQGMEVGVYIVVGGWASQISAAAKKEEADLIVIGPQKKGLLSQFYSGSELLEMVHVTRTPLLVYKYHSSGSKSAQQPFARPLVAVDFANGDNRSALSFFKALGDVVEEATLIHVLHEKRLKGESAMAVQSARKESRRQLETMCDTLEAAGIAARPRVYVGETVSEIERAARENQASMIVTTASRRSNISARFGGSVSRTVAEKTAYPTLIMPPEQPQEDIE